MGKVLRRTDAVIRERKMAKSKNEEGDGQDCGVVVSAMNAKQFKIESCNSRHLWLYQMGCKIPASWRNCRKSAAEEGQAQDDVSAEGGKS